MSDSKQDVETNQPPAIPHDSSPIKACTALKTISRRISYLNDRLQPSGLYQLSDGAVGHVTSERNSLVWALDTIARLSRNLLGPLKDARVVCDRCSVKLETRVTVNGELRVGVCDRCRLVPRDVHEFEQSVIVQYLGLDPEVVAVSPNPLDALRSAMERHMDHANFTDRVYVLAEKVGLDLSPENLDREVPEVV